jgi:hypothetical protein
MQLFEAKSTDNSEQLSNYKALEKFNWKRHILVNFCLTEKLLPPANPLLSLFLHFQLISFKLFDSPTMPLFLNCFQMIHLSGNWFEKIIHKITGHKGKI